MDPPWRRQSSHDRRPTYNTQPHRPHKRAAEDELEDAWLAEENTFVLKQEKKKAEIRVKEGRAKPVDWLAVALRFIDNARNPFDDEVDDADLEVVDPEGVFEGLGDAELAELEKGITHYLALERSDANKQFWDTLLIICKDRQAKSKGGPEGRGVDVVAGDVDKLFSNKTYAQLENQEKGIQARLDSDEPINDDFWRYALRACRSWKARAKLRDISQAIVQSQLQGLRKQEAAAAEVAKENLKSKIPSSYSGINSTAQQDLDPEPLLKISPEDKGLVVQTEKSFLQSIAADRQRVIKLGYVPATQRRAQAPPAKQAVLSQAPSSTGGESQVAAALYQREAARGVAENEEVFAGEEEVVSQRKPSATQDYISRKPRYFNRVQMGYDWNKYNQTHYDHENPPPKVVQGYKFNIFYPDLIDPLRAPTYKIEREHGRKRGQSFAPAGEEDTCLIRFIAGPPYEDIAFRIVDKEWDYSAKRERGFKSSFDKGILQLHFQFKKIFYRK